jgi:hypothetical protein
MSRGKRAESGDAEGARRATVAGQDSAGRGKGRWSARRKATVVLELIRGADLETVSRKYGVTAVTLTLWRNASLEGGEAGLNSRTVEVSDEKDKTLRSAVTGLVMDNELLKERVRQLEDEMPFLQWRSKR